MKRLRTSLLPMLLAILACGAFFPVHAENGYFVQGYVKTDGEVLNERPDDITPMIEWDSRIELSGNPINGATFFGWNVKNEDYKSKVSSIHAFLEIKKDNATYLAKTEFKPANANASDWGQINTPNMESGNYTNILYLEVTWTDNNTSTYEFGPFNYTIKDSTEPKQPTLSISDPSYTYKDASTVTASIKVNYENPDNVAIQGIRVGAVGAPGEAVAGKEYRHDWNKTDDGTGDIVWGDIMLPANWETGVKTVSFDLVNLPENNANINAYFKAYIIPTEGANIQAAEQHLVISTIDTTPALAISDANCVYKDATSVTATVNLDVRNITEYIEIAALSKDEISGAEVWTVNDKPYSVYSKTTIAAAEAANPVSLDVTGLPATTADIPVVFCAKSTANDADIYSAPYSIRTSTVEALEGMVNTVYSESYNVEPYTNGISYTAANFDKDGSIKWTFPTWTESEEGSNANGISGRWVKIEKTKDGVYYAPFITYSISNDINGKIYFSMKIETEENVPDGFNPQFWVNNNRESANTGMTVVEGSDNKEWKWESKFKYPNNSTVSYQLYIASQAGNAATRVFGYDIIGATEAPVKNAANVELTEVAQAHYGEAAENISAQIYTLPAYDAYKAPQKDFEGKAIPAGTWSYTRCPSDFANLNTEAFHFSPEITYFFSNNSQDNKDGNEQNLYFAFQLGNSYGVVNGEERELQTIIPNDYQPQIIVYVPKEPAATASLRADATTEWVENGDVINMKQVTGTQGGTEYLNTYEGVSNEKYAANSRIKVGIKHTFTSIKGGNGYSIMEPRGYVMSSNNEVITGIEEVAAEAEAVAAVATVYNLQGMAVRINVATENALEGLPAGIYIVNGKKYAVR